jgi:bile acid:Na+ symporter, BASS family
MRRIFALLANAFPFWVTGFALLALLRPSWFAWFATTRLLDQSLIVWGLGLIMLGMGLSLTWADFRRILHLPQALATGVLAQFTIMPLLGWSVATLFALPLPFAVGLILTACCPGGTASNIVTFLARANLALSVLLTATSTMAALVLTPWLTGLLAGHLIPVDRWSLFLDTLNVVVLPVIAGVTLNQFFPRVVKTATDYAPFLAALTVAMICASIVANSAETILHHAGILLLAVFTLHAGGFALGYLLAKVCRYDRLTRQTISIEVGMQNSGLAVVLARQNFADPLTAVPGAISSVMHSLIGSLLAGYWRWTRRDQSVEIPGEAAPGAK